MSGDYKNKEIDRLRQSDDSIGEKIDFATLIWRQIDEIRRMRQFSVLQNDDGMIYFSAIEGLIDLLSGIEESSFIEEIEKIEISLEKTNKDCDVKNMARGEYDARRSHPDWFLYGRQYFRVCMKFIQKKGFGLTEIATERI